MVNISGGGIARSMGMCLYYIFTFTFLQSASVCPHIPVRKEWKFLWSRFCQLLVLSAFKFLLVSRCGFRLWNLISVLLMKLSYTPCLTSSPLCHLDVVFCYEKIILQSAVFLYLIIFSPTDVFFVLVVSPLLVLCVQTIFTTCLFTFLMIPSEDQKLSLFLWLHRVLVVAQGILSCGLWALSFSMWDLVPWPGIKPWPLHRGHGVLATGPPGKSPSSLFNLIPVVIFSTINSLCFA